MTSKVKVLHIMSSFGGGISSFIRNKLKAVDASKITFDVVTFNEYTQEFADEVAQTGGKIYHIPNPKKEGFLNYFKTYRSILKKHGPYDLVHCHIGGYRGFSFYLLSKAAGVKRFVIHAHSSEPYYPNGKPLKATILAQTDRLMNRIASDQMISCGQNASFYHFGAGPVNKHEVIHIPNSIDLNKYMRDYSPAVRDEMKNELGLPTNRAIIGHVGRFDQNKNHRLMLSIAEKMKQADLAFTWVFIGTGKLFDQINREIVNRGLTDHVLNLGRREDVHDIYPLMDVFVLPSYSEGLPTVCVESQAAGVPCVVSDSITKEIDMKLGMVEFVSLEDSIDEWIESIREIGSKKKPDAAVIRDQIITNKFSNEASARLYEDFVFQRISHYEI